MPQKPETHRAPMSDPRTTRVANLKTGQYADAARSMTPDRQRLDHAARANLYRHTGAS